MLAWSVLLGGAGFCPNPNVTSRTGTTIGKNMFFMEVLLRVPPRGGRKFHLGFDFASDPYAEFSRIVPGRASGLGTWSIQSGTVQTLLDVHVTVCSKPLTSRNEPAEAI
jgi:hypothetical protein